MNIASQVAKHFREVYFGGNWTFSNYKDQLADVDWKQATQKLDSFNTIAALVFHTNYYVSVVSKVLLGEKLEAHDKFSWETSPVENEDDWKQLVQKSLDDAERFADLVGLIPDEKWDTHLADPKYGSYYRNMHGIIEHCHYHLGQIVILKKLIQGKNPE